MSLTPLRKEFEYFLVLSEHLNVSRAAEVIGIQQGGLSKNLKKLEDEFKETLFIRKKSGLVITEFGKALRDHILTLEDSWKRRLVSLQKLTNEISGHFKLAVHPSVAKEKISRIFPNIVEMNPKLKLALIFVDSSEAQKMLVRGEVNLGLLIEPTSHPDLVLKKISNEAVYCYSKRSQTSLPKHIYFHSKMRNLNKILKKYRNSTQVPVDNYDALLRMAQHTDAYFLLPEHVAQNYLELKRVSVKLCSMNLTLAYRYDQPKTLALKFLISKIVEISGT